MVSDVFGTLAAFLFGTASTETVHTESNSVQQYNAVKNKTEETYKWEISWKNVIAFLYLHVAAIYGIHLFFYKCNWKTFSFCLLLLPFISEGITSGAYRLWAHRSYKAKLPLRIILMLLQTLAFQQHIYEWVRDHRVHHKFTYTNADPYNPQRGFFFSHIGWLMLKKHKDVIIKGKTVDVSDLETDPVVRFQRKYYLFLAPLICFIIPIAIPIYFLGEDPWISFHVAGLMRYALSLNFTWLVNSAAHIWEKKTYDKTLVGPSENAIAAFGEGWHNYHHVFPWDYKAAKLGDYKLNFSTMMIDFYMKIGWAYDLRTVSLDMIGTRNVTMKYNLDNDHDDHRRVGIWGWGDPDMNKEDIRRTVIYYKLQEN